MPRPPPPPALGDAIALAARRRVLSPVFVVAALGIWSDTASQPDRTRWDPVVDVPDLCVVPDQDGRLWAQACDDPSSAMRWAPNQARVAAGLPACWWTLEATDLSTVRGLGEVRARAVIEARDRGVALHVDDLRQEVPGVGPSLAARIVEAVSTACGP